ncbi:hypothetical protein Ddc_10117 [Ditylenchus destructor]|nr:hypothetical protein Ddc_10117 [Ditylenchus destructor]
MNACKLFAILFAILLITVCLSEAGWKDSKTGEPCNENNDCLGRGTCCGFSTKECCGTYQICQSSWAGLRQDCVDE